MIAMAALLTALLPDPDNGIMHPTLQARRLHTTRTHSCMLTLAVLADNTTALFARPDLVVCAAWRLRAGLHMWCAYIWSRCVCAVLQHAYPDLDAGAVRSQLDDLAAEVEGGLPQGARYPLRVLREINRVLYEVRGEQGGERQGPGWGWGEGGTASG